MWKRFAASTLLRIIRSELLRSSDSINPLLAWAYDMQRGRLAPEDFRQRLDSFYRDTDLEQLKRGVGFERKRAVLLKPDAYKVDVHDWRNDGQKRSAWKARLWKRRFAYLRHLGVRCDLLVLRSGEQVPPHGHYRVISGFYVLEG